jgi:hypothetical protein
MNAARSTNDVGGLTELLACLLPASLQQQQLFIQEEGEEQSREREREMAAAPRCLRMGKKVLEHRVEWLVNGDAKGDVEDAEC